MSKVREWATGALLAVPLLSGCRESPKFLPEGSPEVLNFELIEAQGAFKALRLLETKPGDAVNDENYLSFINNITDARKLMMKKDAKTPEFHQATIHLKAADDMLSEKRNSQNSAVAELANIIHHSIVDVMSDVKGLGSGWARGGARR